MTNAVTDLMALQAENLRTSGIQHGFFTRRGGTSQGIYQSLNVGLGSDDDRAAALENRALAVASLATTTLATDAELCTPYQVHGADVAIADTPWPVNAPPKADAVVTSTPGIAVGVVTADCVPVLFADPVNGVVGAAHAGWKGALYGVVENTITAMEGLGAARRTIRAGIGPAIAQVSYEVGAELLQAFQEVDDSFGQWFMANSNDRYQLDLVGFVAARLNATGIESVEVLRRDTYAAPDDFFSYRRTCHAGEPDYGRQLSAILLA